MDFLTMTRAALAAAETLSPEDQSQVYGISAHWPGGRARLQMFAPPSDTVIAWERRDDDEYLVEWAGRITDDCDAFGPCTESEARALGCPESLLPPAPASVPPSVAVDGGPTHYVEWADELGGHGCILRYSDGGMVNDGNGLDREQIERLCAEMNGAS